MTLKWQGFYQTFRLWRWSRWRTHRSACKAEAKVPEFDFWASWCSLTKKSCFFKGVSRRRFWSDVNICCKLSFFSLFWSQKWWFRLADFPETHASSTCWQGKSVYERYADLTPGQSKDFSCGPSHEGSGCCSIFCFFTVSAFFCNFDLLSEEFHWLHLIKHIRQMKIVE